MAAQNNQVYLASLSGALLACALPPLPAGPLAWVALVPLFYALRGVSIGRATALGYIFGVVYHLGALYWVACHVDIPRILSIAAWITASLVLAAFPAATAACALLIAQRMKRAWVWFLPFVWVAFEYARYITEFAFPWTVIAHTQSRLLGLIQQADFWGVLGVSFWVVTLNVLALRALEDAPNNRRRATMFAATFALVVAAAATYGRWRMSEHLTKPTSVRVALVQPNIGMDTKWDSGNGVQATADTLARQTMRIIPGSVDFVLWPETAIPDYLVYTPSAGRPGERILNPRYLIYFDELTAHLGVPLVSGVPAQDYPQDAQFNSAALIMPGRAGVQSYDKRFLVPFGERVPYESVFGFLQKLNLGIARWSSSTRFSVFHAPFGRFGVGICFESVFPRLMSDFVRAGADFLVIMTNDAWFGNTSLVYQHAAFTSFRAIENRVWIARDANTGISALYDPWGRMVQTTGVFTQETLVGAIGHRERTTAYLIWGDWIAVVAGVVSAIGAAAGGLVLFQRRRGREL
jgi:apolipoprotein N-acyltransferase